MSHNVSLTFLGTCSGGGPVESRCCSSLALSIEGDGSLWIVDCAEGTLRQLLSQPEPKTLKISRVNKVFITHLHHDHVMGLLTLLANRLRGAFGGALPNPSKPPLVEIYGPAGLRTFVRSILRMTSTVITERYVVHELLTPLESPTSCNPDDLHPGEFVGTNIICDADGFWRNFMISKSVQVDGGPILHRIPCIGYVFREVVEPRRKVVILGDTHDASAIALLAQDATLLVHEATDAFIPLDIDPKRTFGRKSPEEIRLNTIAKGHSTPVMAGEFARLIRAQNLVLNHFSAKFPAADYNGGKRHKAVLEIERQASEAWGMGNARAAHDYFHVELPAPAKPVGESSQLAGREAFIRFRGQDDSGRPTSWKRGKFIGPGGERGRGPRGRGGRDIG